MIPHSIKVAYIYPKFGAGRNIAIDLVVLPLIVLRKPEPLGYLMLTMGLVEPHDFILALSVSQVGMAISPW